MERVVITGIGISCSTGKNKEEFMDSLYHGRVGYKPISSKRFLTENPVYRNTGACTIDQDFFEEVKQRDSTILSDLAISVVEEAMIDAALNLEKIDKTRAGVCLGTCIGGSYAFMDFTKKRVNKTISITDYELIFKSSNPNLTGNIRNYFGLRGPISTISTACAAGTNSIGRGFDLISRNRIDICVSGGIDIFTELSFAGFNSLQAISKSFCKPFDKERDGMTLGDASAFVILESLSHAQKRGARIYGEVKGYSANNEAYHPTAPNPDGSTACLTMSQALNQAKMDISEIDYINAHGTATGANDGMEINGIRQLIGDQKVYMSSTKSMVGHTLGAAGSVEFIATALGIYHGFIPPSCGITNSLVDEKDNLSLIRDKAINYQVNGALSNSFGFAGCMASIVMKRYNN